MQSIHVRPDANACRRRVLRTSSDDELLTLVRGGSGAAFSELYERHYPDAHRYAGRLARRHLGNDAADDIVAEAVRRVLTALHRGNGPVIGFRQYLFTAVRTVTFTKQRGCAHEDLVDVAPEHGLPAAGEEVDAAVAMTAFASLPQRWRDVLWATKIRELTPTEFAPTVGLRANSAAALAVRAREALRIAYVRAHLPAGREQACAEVLDVLARRLVTAIAPSQQRIADQHLAECADCHRAATVIDEELDIWMRSVGRHAVVESFRVEFCSRRSVDNVA